VPIPKVEELICSRRSVRKQLHKRWDLDRLRRGWLRRGEPRWARLELVAPSSGELAVEVVHTEEERSGRR